MSVQRETPRERSPHLASAALLIFALQGQPTISPRTQLQRFSQRGLNKSMRPRVGAWCLLAHALQGWRMELWDRCHSEEELATAQKAQSAQEAAELAT